MNLSLLTILLTPFFGGLIAYAGANLNNRTRNFFFIAFMALPLFELYPYINTTVVTFIMLMSLVRSSFWALILSLL